MSPMELCLEWGQWLCDLHTSRKSQITLEPPEVGDHLCDRETRRCRWWQWQRRAGAGPSSPRGGGVRLHLAPRSSPTTAGTRCAPVCPVAAVA